MDDNLGVATVRSKIENNMNAINLVQQLEQEDRYATP